jgi:hypothetical protein
VNSIQKFILFDAAQAPALAPALEMMAFSFKTWFT